MVVSEEQIETLRRALDEIKALEAIYGCHHEEGDGHDASSSSSFTVMSELELLRAKDLLESNERCSDANNDDNISQLEVEIRIPIYDDDSEETDTRTICTLRCRLPPGYPAITPASVSISAAAGLRRNSRDELSQDLCDKAKELIGEEAMLELVENLKELYPEYLSRERESSIRSKNDIVGEEGNDTQSSKYGRRWIWVHHITNTDRCKSIVREARELGLGGFLKSGYPGVVVVEGPATKCDEFVIFIKGNKSRPGGFGRNWGHHVRGHIDFDGSEEGESGEPQRRLPGGEFAELEDDMATLSKLCRDFGLEDEFKEYILQHKGS